MTADHNLSADATIALTSGYGGRGFNTQWVQDPDVGVVVECTKVPLIPCTESSVTCTLLLWHGMMVRARPFDHLIKPCIRGICKPTGAFPSCSDLKRLVHSSLRPRLYC